MAHMSSIKSAIRDSKFLMKLYVFYKKAYIKMIGEEVWEANAFEKTNHYVPNFKFPKTLNEKIAWLKINYFQEFYYQCCDKYLLHNYLVRKLGKDYAPKLYFVTQDPKELTFDNIKHFPCIIKVSNGSGANLIVKTREQYTEKYLQDLFERFIIDTDLHTVLSLEHQYEIPQSFIVVEELLKDTDGNLPNDYKFLYINGQLEFVYCSVDRLGSNVRQVYDKDWNRLHFVWYDGANKEIFDKFDASPSIPVPRHFEIMQEVAGKLAVDFPLVRIDFYETLDQIYIGEITLHHGSGRDSFYPEEFDQKYGDKLILPEKNR